MTKHSSASVRQQAPHLAQTPPVNQPTRTNTIINALKRRAQSVLNDRTIDPQSRAIIRYALETNDPWLARLVRRVNGGQRIRVDAGGTFIEALDPSSSPETNEDFQVNTRAQRSYKKKSQHSREKRSKH